MAVIKTESQDVAEALFLEILVLLSVVEGECEDGVHLLQLGSQEVQRWLPPKNK